MFKSEETLTVIMLATLLVALALGGCLVYIIASSDNKINQRRQLQEHGYEIRDSIDQASDLQVAELLAEDVKQHIHYNYSITDPGTYNLKKKILFDDSAYKIYFNNSSGICTDFCEIYSLLLQGAGLNAKYIDRIKTPAGTEHAYVDISIDDKQYRVDITSYCTAALHNADTSFKTYITEV